jgi:hypothetical protein
MFGENHAYLDLEVFKYATAKQLPATRVEIETLQSELDILKEGNSSEKLIKERIKYIEDKIKLLNEIVEEFEKGKSKEKFRYKGINQATNLNKLVFELMLLEHNFNYKNSEFKIDYKGIKVFEKELLGDINDIIKLIQTKEELFAVYKAMLNKNDLTDFADLIPFKNSSLILSADIPTKLASFCNAASTDGSKSLPNLPANLIALNIRNLSSPNLSLAVPTVLTTPFLRSSTPPTKSTTSDVSIS